MGRLDPFIDRFLLERCQIYYWRAIELIKLDNLTHIKDDNIASNLIKLKYTYTNTRLPILVRTKSIDDIKNDYVNMPNFYRNNNVDFSIPEEDIDEFTDILSNIK